MSDPAPPTPVTGCKVAVSAPPLGFSSLNDINRANALTEEKVMNANTIALNDAALEQVCGGGLQNALVLGGWGLVQGGASGAIAGGPVGAAGVGIIAGAAGFIAGMFMSDKTPAPMAGGGGSRRLLLR